MESAENYDEAHDMQSRDGVDVLEEFGDEIGKMSGEIIDIGCGPGSFTKEILLKKLPTNATVTGADISNQMLKYARSKYSSEKRLKFIYLDIETEELPNDLINSFDNAVSFYCLNWCQNIRRVFDNMYKILRPGGEAILLFLADNTGFESYFNMQERPEYQPYMKDVSKYIPYFQQCNDPRATLKKIVEESGFKVQHCSYREKTFLYKDMEIIRKHVVAVNPFLKRMPKDLGKQFADELVKDITSRKILFVERKNGLKVHRMLDRYHVLITHIKKPSNINNVESVP